MRRSRLVAISSAVLIPAALWLSFHVAPKNAVGITDIGRSGEEAISEPHLVLDTKSDLVEWDGSPTRTSVPAPRSEPLEVRLKSPMHIKVEVLNSSDGEFVIDRRLHTGWHVLLLRNGKSFGNFSVFRGGAKPEDLWAVPPRESRELRLSLHDTTVESIPAGSYELLVVVRIQGWKILGVTARRMEKRVAVIVTE